MRALVTGSSGVIGRGLVKKLVDRGYEVTGVDRKEPIYKIDAEYKDVRADLNHSMSQWFADEPDIIFHLAASFERTVEEPGYSNVNYRDNIAAFHNLMREIPFLDRPPRVVFASSYLVYAHPGDAIEGGPLRPRNLVGHAKLYGEAVLDHMTRVDRVCNAVSARIFRVYGHGSRDIISRWIRSALAGEDLQIYGCDQEFDYIHARDVAEGLIRLGETCYNGPVNLGTGIKTSPLKAAGLIYDAISCGYTIEAGGPKEKGYADTTLLKKLTGWTPEISIEEGINDVIEYETYRAE